MHYYQFNIADYRKDADWLTAAEAGIYRWLIDQYYLDEKPIEDDMRLLMRKMRLTSDQKDLLMGVLEHFFTLKDGFWCHERIDTGIAEYHAKSEKARASANARWNANAMRTHSECNANGMLTNNHKPLTNKTHKANGGKSRLFLSKDKEKMKAFAIRNGFSKPRSGESWDSYTNRLQGEVDKRNRDNGFE